MSEKAVLKEYCNFIDALEPTIKTLKEKIDQKCREIGCKQNKEEPFMECNKGCPLFYAWSYLDRLEGVMEEEIKQNHNEDCFCPFAKEHCTDGKVESRPGDECEFWNPQVGDCRVRLVLALLEKRLKEALP
jgi:hypothetical protein